MVFLKPVGIRIQNTVSLQADLGPTKKQFLCLVMEIKDPPSLQETNAETGLKKIQFGVTCPIFSKFACDKSHRSEKISVQSILFFQVLRLSVNTRSFFT